MISYCCLHFFSNWLLHSIGLVLWHLALAQRPKGCCVFWTTYPTWDCEKHVENILKALKWAKSSTICCNLYHINSCRMQAKLNLWIVHELYGTPRVFAYCSPSDLVSDPGAVDFFLGCKIAERSSFANLGRKVGKYVRLQIASCFENKQSMVWWYNQWFKSSGNVLENENVLIGIVR